MLVKGFAEYLQADRREALDIPVREKSSNLDHKQKVHDLDFPASNFWL